MIQNCPEGSKLANNLQNTEVRYQRIFTVFSGFSVTTQRIINTQQYYFVNSRDRFGAPSVTLEIRIGLRRFCFRVNWL